MYSRSYHLILLSDARIQKRPLLRPTISSPYAGADKQKAVLVSVRTPFISTVKRVRKLLNEVDKRSTGKVDLINGNASDKQKLKQIGEIAALRTGKEPEEVVLKATNRAIEKVLGLALYFQKQDDCRVRIRTGTVGVVDDIVVSDVAGGDAEVDDADGREDLEMSLPESRVRRATVVEVAITLR